MSDEIILKATTSDGTPLEATYLPKKGMSLISYKRGNIEVFDQSTKKDFDARSAGLGVMIGPHFHQRRPEIIPSIEDESLFPHIAAIREHGGKDPFSHGVGRYAPWNFEHTHSSIKATLAGNDTWQGIPLSRLEDQNFTMHYKAELSERGLRIEMSVVSDKDSIVGLHYYYRLPKGKGTVVSKVQKEYIANNEPHSIPANWDYNDNHTLTYPLDQDTDFTFHPYPGGREGSILLKTSEFDLETSYTCPSQENSWQLWHPKGASFVCIEPVSSLNPRRPNLTVSSININLEIFSV